MSTSTSEETKTNKNQNNTKKEESSSSSPPPHPNQHRQGLLNFEKVLARLEAILPSAISQRRKKNSQKKIENWDKDVAEATKNDDENGGDDQDSSPESNNKTQQHSNDEQFPDVAIAEALFNCIQSMYVDGECNAPPSNFSLTPGLSANECLSADYPKLVRDYKRVRDKWTRSSYETASQFEGRGGSRAGSVSSRSSSVTSSVVARRRERGAMIAKSKFGKSKVFVPSSSNSANQNDDDDNNNNQQATQEQQVLLNKQLEADEIHHQRRLEEYQEIGSQVSSVRDLQQDINSMLDTQQGALDRTEANVEKAADSAEKGREHLFKAVKVSSFGAGLVGGVVGALVGGPAGFVLGAQSGVAIAGSMGIGGVVGGVVANKVSNSALNGSKDAETDRNFDKLKK